MKMPLINKNVFDMIYVYMGEKQLRKAMFTCFEALGSHVLIPEDF